MRMELRQTTMMAVGHSILVIMFHVLQEQKSYQDLGANYLDERERQTIEKRLVKRLEKLGYQVSLQPTDQVA
jgi:transposase